MKPEEIAELKLIWLRAGRALQSANELLSKGLLEDAASRAYYAVFHGMTALLFAEALHYSSHAAVISEFRKRFIKTGIFPAEHSRIVGQLSEDRQEGDYDYHSEIDAASVAADVVDAKRVLQTWIAYQNKTLHTDVRLGLPDEM